MLAYRVLERLKTFVIVTPYQRALPPRSLVRRPFTPPITKIRGRVEKGKMFINPTKLKRLKYILYLFTSYGSRAQLLLFKIVAAQLSKYANLVYERVIQTLIKRHFDAVLSKKSRI